MATHVIEAIRTPRGKGRDDGALHGVRSIDLLEQLFAALRARSAVEPADVDEIVLGCVTQIGDQGANIAQTAALYSGWHTRGAATTVNSFCTSSLTACAMAAAKIAAGFGHLYVVGGVESMSRVPMLSDRGPLVSDREVSAKVPFVPNPIVADFIAAAEGFTRAQLDDYAVRSHRKAAAAAAAGHFARSLIAVRDATGAVVLDRDELVRSDTSVEAMARLNPLVDAQKAESFFQLLRALVPHAGSIAAAHHPGNAPGMVDGASLALLASAEGASRLGRPVRARLRAYSCARGPAALGLTGGIEAARQALALAGMRSGDIDLWEINEGFAGIVLKFARELQIPPERLNVNGGGIAMGHAMGATGVNLLGTLIDELERRDLQTGLIAISGAAGVGGALVVERTATI